MSKPKPMPLLLGFALLAAAWQPAQAQTAKARFGFATPASADTIAAWNIDIQPDGKSLPPGQGTAAEGASIYLAKCAACHGAEAQGSKPPGRGAFPQLAGGIGTLASEHPVKTVGSYWPYATGLFDYIRRAMPLTAPGSLSDTEVYALSAFILWKNGLLDEHTPLSKRNLATLKMPNADGFYAGDIPR